MLQKVLSLLFLATIIFSGCSSSSSVQNKASSTKNSVVTAPKTYNSNSITDKQKQATTNTTAGANKTTNKVIAPPLTSTEKAKVNDKVNSVVTSIDNVLNSLDEAKELDLN